MPSKKRPRSGRRAQEAYTSKRGPALLKQTSIILGVFIAVMMVVTLVLVGRAGQPAPPTSSPTPSPFASGLSKGAEDAPVTIEEFSDFQCPFCAQFARTTSPQIEEVYINTGKVRFVYRHFAFIGEESILAAMASECANEQGAFWPYHDKIFASQSGENKGAFSKANLKRFAKDMGLDTNSFNQCLDSGKYAQKVADDLSAGSRLGVDTTPTFVVNGKIVKGALPFSQFQPIIEAELAKK
ncbi:MAG: DsbA family protein [Chloroflexi bacterium]|nr:DsbA family protein [Chloroflexota bacterium]